MDDITGFKDEERGEIHPSMRLPWHARLERSEQKTDLMLNFLASGERWTVLSVMAPLIGASEQTARRLAQKMISEGLLKADTIIINGAQLKIYGITKTGLSLARHVEACARPFEIGRTHPSFARHHIECQRVRLVHELKYKALAWLPEKALVHELRAERLGKKVPDAILEHEDGGYIAIEIELNVKSLERMKDALKQHLEAILIDDRYFSVFYYTYDVKGLERLLRKIKSVTLSDGTVVPLDEQVWQYQIRVYDLKLTKKELNDFHRS